MAQRRPQARLSQALKGIDVLSTDGDEIITLDRPDFEQLVSASGRHVELIRP